MNITQKHLKKTQDKIEHAFKNMGIDPAYINWDKLVLKDILRLRSGELESALSVHGKTLQRLAGDYRKIGKLRKSRHFKQVLRENPKAGEILAAYDANLSELRRLHSGYRFLLKKYDKFHQAWERHGLEYRFDFERLGLPVGEWNWRAIDEAYGNFQAMSKEGRISMEEFAFIQESYKSLFDLMMRKLYFMDRHPTLRKLFLDSVIRHQEKSAFLKRYGQRLNEEGLQLGYDVFRIKTDNGSLQELIVPNLYRQKLLEKGN